MERGNQGKEKGREQQRGNSVGPSGEDFSLSNQEQDEVYLLSLHILEEYKLPKLKIIQRNTVISVLKSNAVEL